MAKGTLTFEVAGAPLFVFHALGPSMERNGLKIFRQEGWTLRGQEGLGFFKMGYPVTVVATVGEAGPNRATVTLDASNFGWGLNAVYIRKLLQRVADTVAAAGTMPTTAMAPPPIGSPPVARAPLADESGLPPRVSSDPKPEDDPNLPPARGVTARGDDYNRTRPNVQPLPCATVSSETGSAGGLSFSFDK